MKAKKLDTIIIGGGFGGLSCAATLAEAGYNVLVLEASHRLGGHLIKQKMLPVVDLLQARIQAKGGEILTNTLVRAVQERPHGLFWTITEWGKISAPTTVLALSDKDRVALDITGRKPYIIEGLDASKQTIESSIKAGQKAAQTILKR